MKNLFFILFIVGFVVSCGTENKPTYKVTTTVSPTEGGTITLSPTGGVYSGGETVTITGTPSTGWRFVRWEGDWSGETNPSTLNMTKDYSVIGIFVKRDYPLTINVEGEGTVVERVIPQKTTQYPYQTVVELTPVPSEGWRFKDWSGDLSGSEVPKTITVDGEKTVNVKFERKNYPLTVTVVGEGTVEETIVPQKTTEYPYETVVELTPIPSEGWEFVEWGGDLSGNTVPEMIIVDDEKNVTVTFQLKTYPLNVSVEGNGTINVEPLLDLYPHGSQVTLTPVPDNGWKLSKWSGDGSGTTVPLVITVTSEKTIKGTFIPIVYLSENGITVMCPDGKVGEIGVIDGVEYEVVDRNLLNQRRDEGKDLTKVCVSLITDMSGMFSGKNFNQPIGNWDVSKVTNMSAMFLDTPFNQPIGNWDVSNVTNLREMFINSNFNQPIGDWDVSNVTNMREMFINSNFNQPIGDWNVSLVRDMEQMFRDTPFNHPIGDWNVSNVRNMNRMFQSTVFNQPIGDWNVSNVRDMWGMFSNTPFNQPIGNWDVSNVTDMRGMFHNSRFNQPIGNWNVSNVTGMSGMFQSSQFNQYIGDWDVSNVTNMAFMFYASKFNLDISNWNVSKVINMASMFRHAPFNQPVSNWNVGSVEDFNFMFADTPFNHSIGNWDMKSAKNIGVMFQNTPFNQPIGNWNVSNVTIMVAMFLNSSFNQAIGNWDVSKVTDMRSMFSGSAFNQSIIRWCVTNITFEPEKFSLNSPLLETNKPIWGTCPQR